jgi:glycosyltransferase involved in cell wall biosynthesis
MNICVITSSFPSHSDDLAQAPFLIDFIEGLKKEGHNVFVFTQDREGKKEEFLKGVRVHWFSWKGSKKSLVQLNPLHPPDLFRIGSLIYRGRRAVPQFLKRMRVDACLALWVLPGGYFANFAFRNTGIPYSVWALGSDVYRYGRNPLLHPLMKRIIREARGVFADGFGLSKRVEDLFGRRCLYLATTRALHQSEIPKEPDKPERPYRFLFVGRIERVKGVDLLLKAMALLMGERPDVHLTIIGDGGLRGWVNDFISGHGLTGKVALAGTVSDERLACLYEASDCLVIPSRSESIPLVFSEALRFGKELIVSDVGDMGVLGREYGVARVVPNEDPEALKEMMKEAVQPIKMRRDAAKREELMRFFDIQTSVNRFLADYQKGYEGET